MEIRRARESDLAAVVEMVHELAAYERAPEQCRLTVPQLRAALFGPQPAVYGHVALVDGGYAGFALWFLNFSTWEGSHGIYLEDLYVRPNARRTGTGTALLAALADICVARGYPRLDWSVLSWNPAREFYHALGAEPATDWVPYRLSGPALTRLAGRALGT